MIDINYVDKIYLIHWQLGVYSIVSCLLAVIVSLSVHYIILSAESFFYGMVQGNSSLLCH